jgi:hypothetical protein
MDTTKLTETYLRLVAYAESLEEAHKKSMKVLYEKQAALEKLMMQYLDEINAQNVATSAGTFFKRKSDSVRVSNKAEYMDFVYKQIQEKGVDGLYYLTGAASKDAVKTWISEHGNSLPPGIKYEQFIKVGVRSPNSKGEKDEQ